MKNHRKKLQIESLEARRVLTTYTVDTLLDKIDGNDGVTSLREAILLANQDAAADVIEFAPSAVGTIFLEDSLTLGHLEISQPLTLRGNGRAATVVDGNASAALLEVRRVFNVLPSAGNVTFEDITIQGGALSTFSGPQTGAGINFLSTGRLSIRNSNIAGNLISGSAGGSGGGIHSVGDVWIEGSSITNNYVYSNSQGNVRGGGIDSTGRLVVLNSTIAGNEAFDTGSFRFGPAVSSGGGIYGNEVWVFNSTVSGNRAAGTGGGIRANSANVYSSTVTENTSSQGGGVLSRNQASFFGSIVAGNLNEDFRTFANQVGSRYTLFGNGGGLLAPAMPDANGNLIGKPAAPIDAALLPLTQNGSPTSTHAFTSNSPALNSVPVVVTSLPTGVFSNAEETNIVNALRSDQRGIPRAHVSSEGFFGDMGAHEAEAAFVVNTDEDYLLPDNDGTQTSLREALELANSTNQVNAITFNMGVLGGPTTIKLLQGELPIKEDLTIAGPGANLIEIEASESRVFFIDEGDGPVLNEVKLEGITISEGQSSGDGGNILSQASLTIENAVIRNGSADRGGGIFATGPTKIRDSSIVGNSSQNVGGGVYTAANLTVERSHFLDNTSDAGGGFAASNTDAVVVDSTFTNNQSSDEGGGVLGSASNVVILRSTFVENESTGGDGGGVFVEGGSLTVTNSTISGNTASENGGGIASDSNAAHVRNSTITRNTAKRFGGVSGPVDLQSSIVANNIATIEEADVSEFAQGSHNLIGIIENPDDLVNGENNNQVGSSAAPIDPLLGPLGNHGGLTQVHPLLEMSPALNSGSNIFALTTDQRGNGFIRESGQADVGAFESFNVPPIINPFPMSILPPANFFINEGELFQYQVMASDPDSELIYSVEDQDGLLGPISINPTTGLLSWTPNELAGPSHVAFEVSVSEKDGPSRTASAVVFFFVEEVNTPAVIDPIPDQFVAAGATLNFQATATDSDVPLFHSYTIAPAAEGSLPTGATITPFGDFSFTPTAAQEGQTFFVKLNLLDFDRLTSTVFKITTGVPNTAPQVNGGQLSTNEDVPLDVDLRSFASDVETTDDNLTFNVSAAVGGTVQLLPDGHTARFTPALHTHTTPARFQFSATDEQGASSGVATIQVSVMPVNDKPSASAGTINTQEEIPVTLDLRSLVSDVETPASAFDSFSVFSPLNGSVVLVDDHTAQFTPNPDINSPQQSFSFKYTATDPGDSSSPSLTSDPATVTVVVEAINDVPVVNNATISTDENTPVDIDLRTIVFDKETILDELTFTVGNGVSGLNDPVNGSVALLGDGYTARFTPDEGLYSPDSSFSFQYRVRDTGANLAPPTDSPAATVSVTVKKNLDPAPTATDILAGGSSWSTSFYSLLIGESPNAPIPWVNLNAIELRFDRAIQLPTLDAIGLTGLNSDAYTPIGVSSVSSDVARWTFSDLPTDTYQLTVNAAKIQNLDGVQLDDGTNSTVNFDVVRGDVNRDGITTVADVAEVSDAHGQASGEPSLFDLNGSGEVSVADFILAGRYVGDEKPTEGPEELLRAARIGLGTEQLAGDDDLQETFAAAVDILATHGLPSAEADILRHNVSISFASLPGNQLGAAQGLSIKIDSDAAGWGWFVDETPRDHAEFRRTWRRKELVMRDVSERNHIDLLTVVLHEIGHLVGEDHDSTRRSSLMSETIVPGVRRLPAESIDGAFNKFDWWHWKERQMGRRFRRLPHFLR